MDYAFKSLISELLQYSIQEFLMGYATGISFDFSATRATIREFGRGLPFESVLRPEERTIKEALNITSNLYLCSFRDGYCIWGQYSKGKLVEKGLIDTIEPNGFLIRFSPDEELFLDATFDMAVVSKIVKDCIDSFPGLNVTFRVSKPDTSSD